ncbi:MAG TPA: CPXCG motif-containing cysteine-rich protein [Steroidobacteraceae bacterium]|nr:CPXCG motif-containing cysteine-rich protein [Steroidobacteraceae bacterium]
MATKSIVSTDEKDIDQLYGLEPVIDVENTPQLENTGEGEGTCFVTVACPYCGESYETPVDLTGGSFEYIEDCQICCQPIMLKVEVSVDGELMNVASQQLNE